MVCQTATAHSSSALYSGCRMKGVERACLVLSGPRACRNELGKMRDISSSLPSLSLLRSAAPNNGGVLILMSRRLSFAKTLP